MNGPEEVPHVREIGDPRVELVSPVQVVALPAIAGRRARQEQQRRHRSDEQASRCATAHRHQRQARRRQRGGDEHDPEDVPVRPQRALGHGRQQHDGERDDQRGLAARAVERGRERQDREAQRQRRRGVAQVERKPGRIAGRPGGGLGRDQVRGERDERDQSEHPHGAAGSGQQAQHRTDDRKREDHRPPARQPGREPGLEEVLPRHRARQVVRHREAGVLLQRRGRRREDAQARPRQRVADRDQVARVPVTAGEHQGREPHRRGRPAAAARRDRDHPDGERQRGRQPC